MTKHSEKRDGGPASVPYGEVADRLLAHFDGRRRDLPWRRETDSYRVWISEVMLQQTRVETVIPYYERWLRRFPTLADLAAAPLDDVLLEWQGLGYYSRARNLHAAARVVRERHGGRLPDTADDLRALPGVGEYTAGALASIAFGLPEPAIDTNARRVLARLFDIEKPDNRELRKRALRLIPADRPGDFNQALMELGATVCTARSPRCGRCPIRQWCLAYERGTVQSRPAPRKRAPAPEFDMGTAAIIGPDQRLLLTRRDGRGLLAGLWSLPAEEVRPGESHRAAAARAGRNAGLSVRARDARHIGSVPHAFSHRRETYHVHRFDLTGSQEHPSDSNAMWADAADAESVALPAAQRRILALIFA